MMNKEERYNAMKEWCDKFDAIPEYTVDSSVYHEGKQLRDEYETEMKKIECERYESVPMSKEELAYWKRNQHKIKNASSILEYPQPYWIAKNPNPLNL